MVTLNKPASGDTNWYQPVTDNWTTIETFLNDFRRRRRWSVQMDAGLSTTTNSGFVTVPTKNGTATAQMTSDGQFIQYLSAATINTDVGWISTAFTEMNLQHKPRWTFVMRTGSTITTVRYWMGWFSATPMASATPAVHLMAFRYDTAVDGTTWRAVCDNASGSPTVVDTGVTVSATTKYVFEIDASDTTSVKFYINNSLVATITTKLPTSTQNMSHVEELRTLAASARAIQISKIFVEHD